MDDARKAHVGDALKDPRLPAPVAAAEGDDWTNALNALSGAEAKTLAAAARALCPHDALPDRCYRRVALLLDIACATSPPLNKLVAAAVAALDAHQPIAFTELSEGGQVAALRAIEGGAEFNAIQRAVVRHLYDDQEVWRALGYEGASFQLGGYRTRGFNDLAWLEEPPRSICGG